MTLTDATNRVQYAGDGATTSFAVTFVFWDLDDPQVVLADSDGVETIWVRGTQYTLTGGSGETGTLTVITSPTDYTPASGETLTIKSNLANTQPTDLPAGGDLNTATLEQQLDQIVRQLQQLAETTGRSITLKLSSTESDVTIDDLSGNAGKFAQVNTAEDGFTYAVFTSSGTITDPVPVANGGTGSTTAPAALTALAAAGTGISNTFTKNQVFTKGADLASASPLVLGTDGNYWDVTGTTGFSQITCTAGTLFMLQFDGALTMTDGANLDLAGADIITIAGSRGIFFAVAANTAQLLSWIPEGFPASVTQATQAAVEAETNENSYVPPDLLVKNPGMVKVWGSVDRSAGTPSLNSPSQNVTSVTDDGAGQTIVTIATDFSSAVYAHGADTTDTAAGTIFANIHTPAAGSFKVFITNDAGATQDTKDFTCWAMGDQ